MALTTKIFVRERYIYINPDIAPKEFRELDSFLFYNSAPKNILRAQGGYYRLTKQNSLLFVARKLDLLSFKEWLEVSLNDNFISNHK